MIGCTEQDFFFFFEISIFLLIERGISRMEKLKVMLHFATTEMCLFVFLYLFEFSALIVLIQNSKRRQFVNIFPVVYPSI